MTDSPPESIGTWDQTVLAHIDPDLVAKLLARVKTEQADDE